MTFPRARLALVVAMASDKDHVGFAREFLSGITLIMVINIHIYVLAQYIILRLNILCLKMPDSTCKLQLLTSGSIG